MPEHQRLSDAADEYLRYRKVSGIAVNTIKSDKIFVTRFLLETGNIYVKSIRTDHVERFMTAVAADWSDKTINIARSKLGSFFKFCRSRRWMHRDEDPMENFRRRKVYVGEQRHRIPVDRFPELLDSASHPRDRAALSVGLYLFLRASEMHLLRVGDVHLDTGYVDVTVPKTKVRDQMPISAPLEAELRSWLTYYTEEVGNLLPEFYLVPAKQSTFYYDPTLGRFGAAPEDHDDTATLRPRSPLLGSHRIVQRALTDLGYADFREGIHTLRRSGARALFDELCDQGYDRALEMVSTMLHHSSLGITQSYLGLNESRKRRDDLLRGKPMFAQKAVGNVVPLRSGITPQR